MKKILVILFCLASLQMYAQGKFATASWRSIIGKNFKTEADLPELKDTTPLGNTLLTDSDDPERKAVALFSSGTTVIALFEVSIGADQWTVIDVVEVRNVRKTQEVKVGECRDGLSENPRILALTEKSKQDRWRAVKAWYFNVDKIRVESFPARNVTCFGISGEED